MMKKRGIKTQTSVDKLVVCYTATDEVLQWLSEMKYYEEVYFKLKKIETLFEDKINIQVQDPNTGKYILFGHFSFNRKRANEEQQNYVWLHIQNKVFYTKYLNDKTIIGFCTYITESIGLEGHCISTLDIALNSNMNFAKKIKKAVMNRNLVPIINGKKKTDRKEVINEILYIQKGNQERMTDLSLYIRQKDKKGISLKTYDKFDELEDNNKEYINEWSNIKHPFRLEVTLKKDEIRKYLHNNDGMKCFIYDNENISVSTLIDCLSDCKTGMLKYLLTASTNKLIKFENIETKEILTVFDL